MCGNGTAPMCYVRERYGAYVLFADQAAAGLMRRGERCFEPVVRLFGPEALGSDGELDRGKIAGMIFRNDPLREEMNRIVHPAVREYILETIRAQRAEGTCLFFLEAALLVEEKYNEICDELWYVYADEAVRRKRLKESRGYTDSKITSMIRSQLSEQRFREAADFVINNSGPLADSLRQVDSRLEELSGRV